MPGGAHDPGESLSQTAVRETLEETGISVRLTGVAGIYTDPRHVVHYTSNDEVRQEFTIVYRAELRIGRADDQLGDDERRVGPRRANRGADHGPQPADAARMGAQSDRHLDRPDRRLTGPQQDVSSAVDEPRHQIIRTVSLTDLVEPLLDSDILASRPGRHVGPPKHRVSGAEVDVDSELVEDRPIHASLVGLEELAE